MSQALELKQIKYQNLKKVLQVTVDSTREHLDCDRVVVYGAGNLPKVGVLAESLGSNGVSLAGQDLEDPFLTGEYLEMYCYGMSLTIDDVFSSDIDARDLNVLAQLGVKSVAIAPIYIAQQLKAFLVAHQCDAVQPWGLEAVNLLAEKAAKAGIALEAISSTEKEKVCQITKANPQLAINWHQQLEKIKQLGRDLSQEKLLTRIVRIVRCSLNCTQVLIYAHSWQDSNQVVLGESTLDKGSSCQKTPLMISQLVSPAWQVPGYLTWYASLSQEFSFPDWYLSLLEDFPAVAGLVVPVVYQEQTIGLVIAHQNSAERPWQKSEINFISDLANHLGTMHQSPTSPNGKSQEESQLRLADVQQLIEKEREWTKHFAEVVQQIRQTMTQEAILHNCVGQVRWILRCDRVVVYGLNQDSYGEVIAESVTGSWTKALGMVIKDPCFEARYLAKYRDGRVRAWNDVSQSGLASCYLEQLEQLEVKANLVVPIIIGSQLFGLLVAQQCCGTREWQQSEIFWLTQIATQVGFALENAQLLADVRRLQQQSETERTWTTYFGDVVQQIRQSLTHRDILRTSVREVRRVLNCDRVVVYTLTPESYGLISAESLAHGWTRAEGRVIKDPCFEARYLEQYRDGRVRAWSNIYQAGMSKCYLEQLEKLEIKANLVTPILNQGQLLGLLVANQCSSFRDWQSVEIKWLSQIAFQVGLALDNASLLAQLEQTTCEAQTIVNRAADSSLQIQNAVLRTKQGLTTINSSCVDFSAAIEQIKQVSRELAQQSMNLTRSVNIPGTVEQNAHSASDLADSIFSLVQQLFEVTGKVAPLFERIKTEIATQSSALESHSQQLQDGLADFPTLGQKLELMSALNGEISNLVENIASSLDEQIQEATFAEDSVRELTRITERISHQSQTIIESFNQLRAIINQS